MKRMILLATLSMLTAACSSTPTKTQLSSLSNSDLCYMAQRSGPNMNTTGRVVMGIFTMGITEIDERGREKEQEAYLDEVRSRGLGSCTATDVAEAECKKIYEKTDGQEFKKCVLDVSLAVSSSHTATDAKAAAIAAKRAAAYNAYKQSQQNMNTSWEAKPVENVCCK